jgi:hypothetical protein
MRPRHSLALLLLLIPGLAHAQDAPEQLLPAGTQLYLRWDGIAAHQSAYEKTALGKMMKGDTGRFVKGIFGQIQDGLGALLTVEQLLGGVAPEKLRKMQTDAAEAAQVLNLIGQKGFLLAIEVRSLEPPEAEATVIVPNVGDKPGPLFGAIRLIAGLAKADIKESKLAGRATSAIEVGPIHLAWWAEGKHAVVSFGTGPAQAVVQRTADGTHARLPSAPLFKRVNDFKEFETSARAFVDFAGLVKVAGSRGPEVKKLLDDLGVNGLQTAVLYSGFDGDAERGLTEVETTGSRKGLLSLLSGKPFRLEDVPPLPPDVVGWSMTNFDPAATYDVVVNGIESVVGVVSPDDKPKVKLAVQQVDQALGISLKKDLLDSLGSQFAQYNSPSEGPFNFGQTVLFRVKDETKLEDALEQTVKSLGKLTGADLSIKKRKYHGVTIREIHVKQQGFIFVPTYAIHKGWLVVAIYPQPVQGFVLRELGEMPRWQPSAKVKESLAKLPKEFISVAYSDPRPSIKQLLSIGPLIGAAVNSFNPSIRFEVGSLPNAQEATNPLFPNVAVTTDDGKTIRQESRASLSLPFDVTGIDTYAFFIVLSFARFAF